MSDVMAHTYLRGREGGMEVTGRRGRRRKKILVDLKEKETILEIERGRTRSHYVENWLWKRLWT